MHHPTTPYNPFFVTRENQNHTCLWNAVDWHTYSYDTWFWLPRVTKKFINILGGTYDMGWHSGTAHLSSGRIYQCSLHLLWEQVKLSHLMSVPYICNSKRWPLGIITRAQGIDCTPALKKKWIHFDVKNESLAEQKIRPGIPSNWRIFEALYIESQFDSQYLVNLTQIFSKHSESRVEF